MTYTLRNLILALAICTELFMGAEAGYGQHGHRVHHHRHRHNRYRRDISGKYNPEHHGDHAHVHSHETNDLGGHGEVHSVTSTKGNEHSHATTAVFTSGGGSTAEKGGGGRGGGGYSYAAPPPPVPVPHPSLPPNCGCFQQEECHVSQRSFTELVIRTQSTELVCGTAYKMCCYDDPWPGFTDAFAHMAPCVPQEFCQKHYGTSPTDVAEYGSIGPCPGHDTVRCLDNIPFNPVPIGLAPVPVQINHEGPTHFVVPILETPVIPEVPIAPSVPVPLPPSISYGPPAGYEPVDPPAPHQPPVSYAPPAPAPEPPVSYAPPAPVPEPPVGYLAPTPVEIPDGGYRAPTPVEIPDGGYRAPTPVEIPASYVVPTPIQPPSVSYGVPGIPYGRPLGYYGGGGFGGYPYSRFGGGLYPGFGFRKHFHFSKGFGFF